MSQISLSIEQDHKLKKRQAFGIISLLLTSLLFALIYYINITTAFDSSVTSHSNQTAPSLSSNDATSINAIENLDPKNEFKISEKNSSTELLNEPTTKEVAKEEAAYAQEIEQPSLQESAHNVLPIEDPNLDTDNIPRTVQNLERALMQEAYDTEWAAAVESEIWEKFYQANLNNSDVYSIDCRTTLCKIVFDHENKDAQSSFNQELLQHIANRKGRIFTSQNAQGEPITVVYQQR